MRLLPATPSAWVKWISGGSVVLWVVLAATLNAAQPGDNIEQLLWSSELAWGYAKHPPLTTWMLMGAQSVFGRAPQLTYGLAAACHLATLFLLYRIGSQLLNPQSGIWVLLILSMTYAFTRKAQFYNHNTVLLLGLSLATWLTLQALQGNRWSMWVFQGLSFGLLILAKYQSAIGVFLLYVMVIHATGWRHWKHMCLSTITMLILLMPHIAWLITQDKVDSPVTYAQHYTRAVDVSHGLSGLMSYGASILKQYVMPLMMLLMVWPWRQRQACSASLFHFTNPLAKPFILHSTLTRAMIMVAIGLVGVRLQDHWAMPLALFLSLPMAHLVNTHIGAVRYAHLPLVLALQVAFMAIFALQHQGYLSQRNMAHIERHLNISEIMDKTNTYWRAHTTCPLKFVKGDQELTAMLAAYWPTTLIRPDADTNALLQRPIQHTPESMGHIRLTYLDTLDTQRGTHDGVTVSAYAPLNGLPNKTILVEFSFPMTACD